MCLTITKDSRRLTRNLKRQKGPVIAYKILNPGMRSEYYYFQWKVGLNISDRRSTKLTENEIYGDMINEGFHLALNKPEKCPYLNPYQCSAQYNKVFKCEIDPKDIISTGIWSGIPSITATKVTLLEEEI